MIPISYLFAERLFKSGLGAALACIKFTVTWSLGTILVPGDSWIYTVMTFCDAQGQPALLRHRFHCFVALDTTYQCLFSNTKSSA